MIFITRNLFFFGLADFTVKDWKIDSAPDDEHLIEC